MSNYLRSIQDEYDDKGNYIGNSEEGNKFHGVKREGGPLEWFNPPIIEERHFIDVGTREKFVEKAAESAREEWDNSIATLIDATTL